ncbi:ubiquitin carboxyl-terminal hydrolase 15-like [Dorcoceras hygrometricum]|uniref:Ubiquitin carboxyl-terminal hydrolase 15-like n=1 Tax=Dorcoceras hygrometricum TaxID=472368 RepID=A0A2Z7C3K3_9LAMI|nr:ubiquitin carboxyl-terminal hydrolase 15-like [Dorcoceras hygrometricum]
MQHAIINAMKCMRAIKDRIARPVYQLENHLVEPLYHARCIKRGNHRSMIFRARQSITAQWYSDTTNQSVTTPMIALDFSGTTHLSASNNMALNQVINQSVNQAQDVCISISADFTTSIIAMFTLKAVKSAQFVPSTADSTSTDLSQGTETHGLGYQLLRAVGDPDPPPAYIERVDILQQKPAVALNKNQQQPTDVAFAKEHQNDAASTNQNDAVALQHLTTDFFPNNQQMVALNNSNDIVKDTSPLLPTADQKRYTQNAAFQLIKTTSPLISD